MESDIVKRDVLELDYTRLRISAVNTTIAWRYSSLTCQPSVFTVEEYADRDTLRGTSIIAINSSSTELMIPQDTTSRALYLRILAYDEFGMQCAVDSAVKYYKLDNNGEG